MTEDETTAFAHNDRYALRYRRVLRGIVFMSILCAVLTAILVFLNLMEPQPDYYASTMSGQVIRLSPLDQPVLTNDNLLRWSGLAVRAAYNLDFNNYDQQLTQASAYFTQAGFEKFKAALKQDGLLDSVIDNKLLMNAVVSGPAVILDQGVLDGFYTWTLQMPLLVTFSSASESNKMQLIVTMHVRRVSNINAPQGIQISDFVSQESNGTQPKQGAI